MKLKTLILTVALALGACAVAVAGPPAGKGKPAEPGAAAKGKPATTGSACKPKVSVILKGTLVQTGSSPIVVDVERTNHHGKAWKLAGVSIQVDDNTRYVRKGKSMLESLAVSDIVIVHARVCKADLANGGTPDLLARKVIARAPAAS